MEIKKNALNNQQNKGTISVLGRASEGREISSAPDVLKHVRALLISNSLSLEDIIKKYQEIVSGKIQGTKVSDIIKVLELAQRIHLADSKNALDASMTMLEGKNPEEIAEYTRVTLQSTQIVLERIRARRVNEENQNA